MWKAQTITVKISKKEYQEDGDCGSLFSHKKFDLLEVQRVILAHQWIKAMECLSEITQIQL